jgi:SmpA/OmlA family protein
MRKWLRRFCVEAGLFVVLAGHFFFLTTINRITKENFAKIRGGMTVAEVEAILGRAHSKEASGRIRPQEYYYWYGRKGKVRQQWISIDVMDGLVIGKDMDFGEPLGINVRIHGDRPRGMWDRFMDWLGVKR